MEKSKKKGKYLEFIPGQVLIRVKDDSILPEIGKQALSFTSTEADRLPYAVKQPFEYLRKNKGLRLINPIFSSQSSRIQRISGQRQMIQNLSLLSSVHDSESEDLAGINVLHMPPKMVTSDLIQDIRSSNIIDIVEKMPARWLCGEKADPKKNLQWGHRAIKWFLMDTPDAFEIIVAVLDTGIDTKHKDFVDVINSYYHKGLAADDIVGHGTHVAGIIAAKTNNEIGISGVARCQIAAWKIFPDEPIHGNFYVDGNMYLRALNATIKNNIKVVNCSIGGTSRSQVEEILYKRLSRNGILVIAAMGNEYIEGNPVEYPAAYPDVIAVGAITETQQRAKFSCTGRHITLVAPGSNIISTLPVRKSLYRNETKYASWSGTSMAAPYVSAAVASFISKNPNMSSEKIRIRLRETAIKIPDMRNHVRTKAHGSGLLNIQKLLDIKSN